MKFELLIATVDDKFMQRNLLLKTSFVIVNQLINLKKSNHTANNIFSYQEKGLSKSRNHALKKASADICLLTDDDISYKENIEKIIIKAFLDNPKADIITFQVQTPDGGQFKPYLKNSYWHNYRTLMGVSSCEVAFKRKVVVESGINFDEDFGLGAKYLSSEENIFLVDALGRGLKILYIPIPIVVHPNETSSDFNRNNIQYIKGKGAMFYRMFKSKGYFIAFLFALKQYNTSNYGFFSFFKAMLSGINEYK
ncbi:Glycosyl transferase, group 2 family protein [uncultured Candidatus Thioglobus sp.]|nr:Glycosyl transferase, group 2 family protein [uncultured Candidatus Thioglobus sp.]